MLATPSDINLVGSSRDSLDSRFLRCPLGPGCRRRGPGGCRGRGWGFSNIVPCVVGNRFDGWRFARREVPSLLRYGVQHGFLRLRTGHPPAFPFSNEASRGSSRGAALSAGFGPAESRISADLLTCEWLVGIGQTRNVCRADPGTARAKALGERGNVTPRRRKSRPTHPYPDASAPAVLPLAHHCEAALCLRVRVVTRRVIRLRGQDGSGAIDGARCDHVRLVRNRLDTSAASVRTGFSDDGCPTDGSSLTGVAHPSAMRSSASRSESSNISSTERCERSTPSRHSASLWVNRMSIATEPKTMTVWCVMCGCKVCSAIFISLKGHPRPSLI